MRKIREEKGARLTKRHATDYLKKHAEEIEKRFNVSNLRLTHKVNSKSTSSIYWTVEGDGQENLNNSLDYWMQEDGAETLEDCLVLAKERMTPDAYILNGEIVYDIAKMVGQIRVSHHELWRDEFPQEYSNGVYVTLSPEY